MNSKQVETNVQQLLQALNKDTFIYDFLLAYGSAKSSITRLRKGNMNLSKEEGVVSWKKKVLFKVTDKEALHLMITELRPQAKHKQRFVIVTNFETLLAIDTKLEDTLDIPFTDLAKHYDFFLPLAGMEKAQIQDENEADVKAAERMAKLFNEIQKDNPDTSPEFLHSLNVFLSRLLFCFFAEDTNIFEDNQLTSTIKSHTQKDGSDLDSFLNTLFDVLNTPKSARTNLPAYLDAFPYVNGGLFRENLATPTFTARSRKAIIDSGTLDWSAINPDIFGSMFQSVIRGLDGDDNTKHYTSVPNIMKVIEPLFLNELKETFENAKGKRDKLNELLKRLSNIKIFDPACGSGNFLIIAYKELRKLEIQVITELQKLEGKLGSGNLFGASHLSKISLAQFYGIELNTFAAEIAQLSLWLAEHQMNSAFLKAFGRTNPTLPLREAGNIVQGNACRLDWETVCPKQEGDEIYILGNPPFLGDKVQSKRQKEELQSIFIGIKNTKAVDYVGAWFIKASEYICGRCQFAFVSTNSINQGVQVPLIWSRILEKNQEIGFAHKNFVWSNNAKKNAGVICSIIGVRIKSNKDKFLFESGIKKIAKNINAYLVDAQNIIVAKHSSSISSLPLMTNGNIPRDKGNLMLDNDTKKQLEVSYPAVTPVIHRIMGSKEFLNNIMRWCLWINDNQIEKIKDIPPIKTRIDNVRDYRINGSERGKLGINTPHKFERTLKCNESQIIIPRVSSGRREYIPVGFLDKNVIVSDAALVIFDTALHIMSILSSKMHIVWLQTTAGRLKADYRYSVGVCYNSFPFPKISDERKQGLTKCVLNILAEREKHPEKTLAQLYDPDKMPDGLRIAHQQNDEAVERCYRSKPFGSDEERLAYLFKLYEKMIAEEQAQNTLFAAEKKQKRKRKAKA